MQRLASSHLSSFFIPRVASFCPSIGYVFLLFHRLVSKAYNAVRHYPNTNAYIPSTVHTHSRKKRTAVFWSILSSFTLLVVFLYFSFSLSLVFNCCPLLLSSLYINCLVVLFFFFKIVLSTTTSFALLAFSFFSYLLSSSSHHHHYHYHCHHWTVVTIK